MAGFISKILDIKNETYDVKTFRIKKPLNFNFISGQYCLVSFVDGDEKKPFTFSSSPTDDFLELTIKEVGEFTKELFKLKKGDKLRVEGAYGKTLNFIENEQNIVYIAGGSGITPFMSAIRYVIKKKLNNKIVLFLSNRSERDIIYKKELDKITNENIKAVNTLTNEVLDGWKGEKGYINEEMVKKYIKDLRKYIWYACGPPSMNKAMRELLEKIGISDSKIKIEGWEIGGKHSE